jgi:hypothetical protein
MALSFFLDTSNEWVQFAIHKNCRSHQKVGGGDPCAPMAAQSGFKGRRDPMELHYQSISQYIKFHVIYFLNP